MNDGYAKPEAVTFTTRADMQESIAGLDEAGFEREWMFALNATDWDDPDTLRWLASLATRRIAELDAIPERLEYLRSQLDAECISQGELIELQGLAEHIDPGDVQLLEAAGVPEFADS